jgi:hypothetical protein
MIVIPIKINKELDTSIPLKESADTKKIVETLLRGIQQTINARQMKVQD